MHHGDGITGVASGVLLSITANAAGWIGSTGFAHHAMETLVFGFIGGIGGLIAKRGVESVTRLREARSKNKNNNNKQNNEQ